MKQLQLQSQTVDELVQHFAAIALKQDEALLENEISKVSRLYWQLKAVEAELKVRGGDQRRALLRLYDHPNAQVRLKAAKATLAIAPQLGREMLEEISQSGECPQAGEAGMSIYNLDAGIYKPT